MKTAKNKNTHQTVAIILFLNLFILPSFSSSNAQEYSGVVLPSLQEGRKKVETLRQETIDKLSAEDLEWYQKFNEGILFFDGWKEITETVLEKYTPEDQEDVLKFMQHLGIRIGAEWSKDNDIRMISTDMLRAWGKEIRTAAKKEKADLTIALHKLENEVTTILQSAELTDLNHENSSHKKDLQHGTPGDH